MSAGTLGTMVEIMMAKIEELENRVAQLESHNGDTELSRWVPSYLTLEFLRNRVKVGKDFLSSPGDKVGES